jgi:uncharacterized DUF497 family protein
VEFEWDEAKRLRIMAARRLDFLDASLLFDGRPIMTELTPRNEEERWLSVGKIEGLLIAIVWTWRGERIRIITMRRARDGEKRRYQALHGE